MNWAQFKDLVCHMCLAWAVVPSWSPKQEVAGLSPFTAMPNIFTASNKVCHSVHREGIGFPACITVHKTRRGLHPGGCLHPGDLHPGVVGQIPRDTLDTMGYNQQMGGTHSTGMFSCHWIQRKHLEKTQFTSKVEPGRGHWAQWIVRFLLINCF